MLIVDHATGRNGIVLLHADHEVWFPDVPAVFICWRRRQVARIALGRT
jgi:hypothetical protein